MRSFLLNIKIICLINILNESVFIKQNLSKWLHISLKSWALLRSATKVFRFHLKYFGCYERNQETQILPTTFWVLFRNEYIEEKKLMTIFSNH